MGRLKSYNYEAREVFFTEENRILENQTRHGSDCGKFYLVVDVYKTKKGSWNYTRGRVFRTGEDEPIPIADIKRNYGGFGFAWVYVGPHRKPFLVCGFDYQGQTFVDLSTGERRDELSPGAEKGFGFCWIHRVQLKQTPDILQVSGCHWACPYEYRFFDISDPIGKGWPQVSMPEEHLSLDCLGKTRIMETGENNFSWHMYEGVFIGTGEWHRDVEDTSFDLHCEVSKLKIQGGSAEEIEAAKAAENAHDEKYSDPEDDPHLWDTELLIDRKFEFVRDAHGVYARLLSETKHPVVLKREELYLQWKEKRRAQEAEWKQDPIFQELSNTIPLKGRVGIGSPSLNDKWKGEPNPAFFRVTLGDPKGEENLAASLQWGVNEGPLKLSLWLRGKGDVEKPQFPRTSEGLHQALRRSREYLAGGSSDQE